MHFMLLLLMVVNSIDFVFGTLRGNKFYTVKLFQSCNIFPLQDKHF
jgi:hypothetical protein